MTPPTEIAPTLVDLEYCSHETGPLHLDLYLPEQPTGPVPLVAWFHGGGWMSGDKGSPAVRFLVEEGIAVADVQYRLTTTAAAPANLHDCRAALRWLRSQADTYGLDPDRLGVSGGSAGAHLALLLGAPHGVLPEAEDASPVPIRCICSLAGPTDITCIFDHEDHLRYEELLELLCALVGGPLDQHLELARAISPIQYVRADHPPVFMAHGAVDDVVDVSQARHYVSAMRQAGGDVTYQEEPSGDHTRDSWDWPPIEQSLRAFFRHHLLR